jgi:MFS family permease
MKNNDSRTRSMRTITFTGLLVFLMSVGEGAVAPAIPLHGDALGASYRQLGFFMAGYSIAYTLMTVAAGSLSDKLGRKSILLFSILLSITASIGYYYASTPESLMLFRTLEGASRGILWPLTESIIADNAECEIRGKIMGRFTAAYGLGAVVGTFSGGLIMQHLAVTAVFPIYPVIGIIVLGTSLYGISDKPADERLHHSFTGMSDKVAIGHEIKKIWPVCLSGFAYAGFIYSIWGLLPKIADLIGAPPQQIGYLFSIFWGMRLVSFLASGELATSLGRRIMLLTGISFIIISTLIFFAASSYTHLLLAAAAGGVGTGIMFTITITLIAELINPAYIGFGMGFLEFCMGIGMIMQTTLSGIIGELLGTNFTYLLVFISAIAAFIAAYVYLPPDRKCSDQQ